MNHLFSLFKNWTFYPEPYAYIPKQKNNTDVKSFSFKIFAHVALDPLWDVFIVDAEKIYKNGNTEKHLTYRIADDGFLHKTSSIILHTQCFF